VEIYIIGFTQTTAEGFFTRLTDARIERLLDVRLNNSSQLAGFAKAEPARPESEDHRFQTARARYVEDLADPEFLGPA
jgi:hypothetical protein